MSHVKFLCAFQNVESGVSDSAFFCLSCLLIAPQPCGLKIKAPMLSLALDQMEIFVPCAAVMLAGMWEHLSTCAHHLPPVHILDLPRLDSDQHTYTTEQRRCMANGWEVQAVYKTSKNPRSQSRAV